MRLRRTVLAVGCVLLAAPATASAASTFTVDPAAATGCNGTTCKTIKDALAAAAAGDTISILKGSYGESGTLDVTKDNITLTATPGTVAITNTSGVAGQPVIKLTGKGVRLSGLVVSVPENGGQAVMISGADATLDTVSVLNVTGTTQDTPSVQDAATAGTTTLSRVIVVHTPQRTGDEAPGAAAVTGSAGGATLAIADSVILSGDKAGDAVLLRSNGADRPNTIVRSQLFAESTTGDALQVFSPQDSSAAREVRVDTAVLSGGQNGAGLHAISEENTGLLGTSDAGPIDVDLEHVTVAGSDRASILEAQANGDAAGSIDVTVDRSIWHGKNLLSNHDGQLVLPTTSPNTAKLTIVNSDTEQKAQAASSGTEIAVSGARTTGDAALFVDIARNNFHLRADAPAIDQGGAAVGGESDKDIDGQARQNGAATDLGADEFHNIAPVAKLALSAGAVKQNQPVTLDASGSIDPETGAGGSITRYRWDFGDGQTQETTTPAVQHAYGNTGVHQVKVSVVDNFGAVSAPAIAQVAVGDGTPPTVTIATPRRGFVLDRFRNVRVRDKRTRRVRTVRRARTHRFAGTVQDASGIATVEVSYRVTRVVSARGRARSSQKGTCRYLDPRSLSVVGRPCSKPIFFRVAVREGQWAYRTKARTKYRLGRYELTVRATDKGGNQATATLPFTVR